MTLTRTPEQLVAKCLRGNAQFRHVKTHHIGFHAFDINANCGRARNPFCQAFCMGVIFCMRSTWWLSA